MKIFDYVRPATLCAARGTRRRCRDRRQKWSARDRARRASPPAGDTSERESALETGDLIVALRLPGNASSFAAHARYLKLRERTSFAFAVVSAAAALDLDGGVIRSARLALGGVAAKPWRARASEEALAGANADEMAFRKAARSEERRVGKECA